MSILKNSLIYKLWLFIRTSYQNSYYHKLGLFFSKKSKDSKSLYLYNNYINKAPASHNVILIPKVIDIFAKPFRFISNNAKESICSKILKNIQSELNKSFIYSILLIMTTFSLGINIALFIKGDIDILYSSLLVVSIISFFIYIKVEKYIVNSLIYKLLNTIFN